jgi:transcriptional regulator with XRE-family HTH domain
MSVLTLVALEEDCKNQNPEKIQGRLIRAARNYKGLTQAELGERVGLSQKRISQIELGSGTTSVLIYRIAKALGQPANSFEV